MRNLSPTLALLTTTTIILLTTIFLLQPTNASTSTTIQERRSLISNLRLNHHHPIIPSGKKKKTRLSKLFSGGGGKRRRKARRRGPPRRGIKGQESKNVFYYSIAPTTVKPRIILGEELNFNEMGIQKSPSSPSPSHASIAQIEQHLNDYDYEDSPIDPPPNPYPRSPRIITKPQRPPKQYPPKRATKGPGYRLHPHNQNNWQDHYVVHSNGNNRYPPPNKKNPKVMTSMMRAAGELRNAYKAAIIQSAKVAKFTGHAVGNYFKGVRNIFGGDNYNRRKEDNNDGVLEIPTAATTKTSSKDEKEEVQPDALQLYDEGSSSSSDIIPNVYLDWGGSFWKFFYNKSNGKGSSLSQIEQKE